MAAQINPQVRRAVVKLRELSANEIARDMVERREKGRRDLAMYVADAEHRKAIEVAQAALEPGIDIDTIIKLSSLNREEVETLSAQQGK